MARQGINLELPKEQRTTKSRRILINMRGSITDQEAIDAVQHVISKGKTVIAAKDLEHYSRNTVMENGVVVQVTPNYRSRSEIFTVSREDDIEVVYYIL